ncbi:MAG: hypothetical protein ACRDVZ_12205 [Jiangellaceae bacterium]
MTIAAILIAAVVLPTLVAIALELHAAISDGGARFHFLPRAGDEWSSDLPSHPYLST